MSADQRTAAERDLRDGNRELQLKVQQYQDDFNARQNEELSKLQKTLVEEVQSFAQAQKFDLVLADGVIFAAPVLDVTPAGAVGAAGARRACAAVGAAGAAPKAGSPAAAPKGNSTPK